MYNIVSTSYSVSQLIGLFALILDIKNARLVSLNLRMYSFLPVLYDLVFLYFISFSAVANIFSPARKKVSLEFYDTQLQCYLLKKKMMKKYIEPAVSDELSSYHLKTIVFWQSEERGMFIWKSFTMYHRLLSKGVRLYRKWGITALFPQAKKFVGE